MTTKDICKFTLSSPIKVQSVIDGENQFIDQDIIYLKAPSQIQMRASLKLRQSFLSSFNHFLSIASSKQEKQNTQDQVISDEQESKEQESELIPVKEIITILNFGGEDIEEFYKMFYNFVEYNNVLFIDESATQILQASDIDSKLSFKDYELLAATYIQIFFTQYWT